MPATASSVYQVIAANHQAGNPPNTEYQRANETYETYIARMAGNELPPDINPTESDSDYLTRLATYVVPDPLDGGDATLSASVSTAKQNALVTGGTYTVTASYATKGAKGATGLVPISAGVTASFVNGFYTGSVA